MSDLFISYAREDREQAARIAEHLGELGWSVWWDDRIAPGKSFDSVIESELNQARCVIVLWSPDSVSSAWVRNEAAEGIQRGVLVPALIRDVKVPLGFRHIQAANLVNWRGDPGDPELQKLIEAVSPFLGQGPKSRKSAPFEGDQASSPLATPSAPSTAAPSTPTASTGSSATHSRRWLLPLGATVAVASGVAVWTGRALEEHRVLETLRAYHQDLNDGKEFRAERYFAPHVESYYGQKNINPQWIQTYLEGDFPKVFKHYRYQMDEASLRREKEGSYSYANTATYLYGKKDVPTRVTSRIYVKLDGNGLITSFEERDQKTEALPQGTL